MTCPCFLESPVQLCSPVQAPPIVISRLEPHDGEDGDGCIQGRHAVDQGNGHGVLLTVVPGHKHMAIMGLSGSEPAFLWEETGTIPSLAPLQPEAGSLRT